MPTPLEQVQAAFKSPLDKKVDVVRDALRGTTTLAERDQVIGHAIQNATKPEEVDAYMQLLGQVGVTKSGAPRIVGSDGHTEVPEDDF